MRWSNELTYKNFTTDLRFGKEQKIRLYKKLQSLGMEVKDVSKIPEYQLQDIDMILKSNNKIITVEIKGDKRIAKNKNIFIEDIMERQTGDKDGWLHYCKCHILCYIDSYNDIAYLVNWRTLKKFILNEGVKSKYYRRFYNKIDDCWTGGYLMPLEFLRENDYIFRCIILKSEGE